VAAAARALQHQLPAWSRALYEWGREAERLEIEGRQLVQKLLLVQAAFELVAMGRVGVGGIGSGAGRAGAFALVLPGIGGVTAGGAITGVRVVISAEGLEAMRHLSAIGAISGVSVVKIAGVSSLAASTPSPPRPPPVSPIRQGGTDTVQVLVQHKGGSRQVAVNGQRWHLPKGKSPADIPASDPVGDRLQAAVDKVAGRWDPGKLREVEQDAIDKARAAGKPWLARLLEQQAKGRWVEREAARSFHEVQWYRRGVDAVDHRTGIKYEILSGTRENMDLHAKRMAEELFRMIAF
jgi:hypothetical protein